LRTTFVSLDRGTRAECEFLQPDRWRDVLMLRPEEATIARGSGLSYVGASFAQGGTSIGMGRFDRILGFDSAQGWIEVEVGCTVGKLYSFLAPRGLRLPVQPGYPTITIGGCIAGNVHGKNHMREGVFGRHVLSLRLRHPDHGILECSETDNAEAFDLTIGGLGLTGIILSARLALMPLEGTEVSEEHLPIASLEEAFAEIARLKDQADMLYAWLDLSRPSHDTRGNGFITLARTAPGVPLSSMPTLPGRLDPSGSEIKRLPLFRAQTLPWVNRVYRAQALRHRGPRRIPLADFLFPAMGKESYFHFFGNAGFFEQQVLLPADAVASYLPDFRRILARHGAPVALTTLKAFDGGRNHLLHYDGEGFSFSIDLPDTPESRALAAELDELNCSVGGKTCVIKDGRLSAATARRQFPDYDQFRARLAAFDPRRLFASELSRRLDL